MKGKVVLITGATNGIGLEAARAIAKKGARVVIVGRNPQKTREVAAQLTQESGAEVSAILGDLSLMRDVRKVADEFRQKFDRLDVLLNNAGAVFNTYQRTEEGNEMTFALNHLNYFLLTHLLLDMLKASAPARIINVSSNAHRVGPLDVDNLQSEKGFSAFGAYGRSKLENIMFTYELARRLEGTDVTVNALHPGFVRTGFGHNMSGIFSNIARLAQIFAITLEQGAETSIYLATSPEVEGVSGRYFVKSKAVRSSNASYDETAWRRLWEASEKLTGIGNAAHA
mgnify:CR=1 FL=1